MLFALGCTPGANPAPTIGKGDLQTPSPYQHFLPQAPPSEANRVRHLGYSIIAPSGWKCRTIPVEPFLKGYLAEQLSIEGPQPEQSKAHLSIQRLGPQGGKQFSDCLQPGRSPGDGYRLTQFQERPAFEKFLTGFGKRQAVRGTYQPYLLQEVVFERGGQWFRLEFSMKNADYDKPYYTQPLPIIRQYFEIFRSER
jgi:hypothetical protein